MEGRLGKVKIHNERRRSRKKIDRRSEKVKLIRDHKRKIRRRKGKNGGVG